ncbi:MAG TPA: sigma 54-interacting transcriptional regulator [Deferrisomatales bacterium]|nr:sigma 54-interacting transcriptional regulator [Deferrisomatales bacterium]
MRPQAAHPEPRFLCGAVAMETVGSALERAAATDVGVVLYGEPGAGKSFAAAHLHRLSPRRQGALRRLSLRDPGAPASLARPGYCEELEGGTLVLEGVDEASAEAQTVLVGVLETWSAAVGGGEAPVRVVATSEQDLAEAVAGGRFRADLFYLLEVIPVCLPPLRQRAEEIPELVAEFACRAGWNPAALPGLPRAFLEQAMGYGWPGNLQELAGMVIRALPPGDGAGWCFPPLLHPRLATPCLPPFHTAKREFEQSYVSRLLLVTGGNVTQAAEFAGKARKDFYALMARNRMDPSQFRPGSGT